MPVDQRPAEDHQRGEGCLDVRRHRRRFDRVVRQAAVQADVGIDVVLVNLDACARRDDARVARDECQRLAQRAARQCRVAERMEGGRMPRAPDLEPDARITGRLDGERPQPLHAGERVAGIRIAEKLRLKPGAAKDIGRVDTARRRGARNEQGPG